MSDIFISYARSTETQAQLVGDALRSLGYNIWRDDELPAHRAYADVIEERLKAPRLSLSSGLPTPCARTGCARRRTRRRRPPDAPAVNPPDRRDVGPSFRSLNRA
jgi:hypothetical protein